MKFAAAKRGAKRQTVFVFIGKQAELCRRRALKRLPIGAERRDLRDAAAPALCRRGGRDLLPALQLALQRLRIGTRNTACRNATISAAPSSVAF